MSVTVRVPASTSNLGAGFDCVGVAVDRWLRLTVHVESERGGPSVERHGTLRTLDLPVERDLLFIGFAAACRAVGRPLPSRLVLRVVSDIPVGRGLGSSAAAVVAGAAAADALLGLGLDHDALITLAAAIEGHPDNVAAAVCGGGTLTVPRPGDGFTTAPLDIHPALALVFAVPDFSVVTAHARAALPASLRHATAARAAAGAAGLILGLARGDAGLLAVGLDDGLHVPYRRGLVPGYDPVTAAAVAAGAAGATLSGSGSSIVAITAAEQAGAVGEAMVAVWREHGITAQSFSVTGRVDGVQVSRRPVCRETATSTEV